MTDTTSIAELRRRDTYDEQAARFYKAMALRAQMRHAELAEQATEHERTVACLPERMTMYHEAVNEALGEDLGTAAAALAAVEFVSTIHSDRLSFEMGNLPTCNVENEADLVHEAKALGLLVTWTNNHALREYIAPRVARAEKAAKEAPPSAAAQP